MKPVLGLLLDGVSFSPALGDAVAPFVPQVLSVEAWPALLHRRPAAGLLAWLAGRHRRRPLLGLTASPLEERGCPLRGYGWEGEGGARSSPPTTRPERPWYADGESWKNAFAEKSRVVEKAPGRFEVHIDNTDVPQASRMECSTGVGYIYEGLRITGARDPVVTHPLCRAEAAGPDRTCVYAVTFR